MKKLLVLFVTLFLALFTIAQQTVTGKITDANGLPLAGVSVKSQKTGRGVVTAADGSFRVSVGADDQLEISSVGYVSQTVAASATPMNITMTLSVIDLNQVVLIGTRRSGRVKTETPVPID